MTFFRIKTKVSDYFPLLLLCCIQPLLSLASECTPHKEALNAKKTACGLSVNSEETLSTDCEEEINEIRMKLAACQQKEYDQKRASNGGKKLASE